MVSFVKLRNLNETFDLGKKNLSFFSESVKKENLFMINTEALIRETQRIFQEKYHQSEEKIVLSPGRINLIGEHIDYNDGYVLPAAIDKYICFSARPNYLNSIRVYASDIDEFREFDLNSPIQKSENLWENYFLGVIDQALQTKNELVGLDLVFSSNLPIGAGLSSSAALSCGFATLMNDYSKLNWSKKDIALKCQWTEHEYVGVKCGIMDQFASVFGKENSALLLDCLTMEVKYYPTNFGDYSLVLFDSCVKHSLVATEYNQRRDEVNKGFDLIKRQNPNVQTFRDLSLEMIHNNEVGLSEIQKSRLQFIIKEIERTLKAVTFLENGQFEKFGKLLSQTHEGLSKEYEVSCTELDFLVNEALKNEHGLGSRMMGGGFGGCSINLIKTSKIEEVSSILKERYFKKIGIELKIYPIHISNGTQIIESHDRI